MYEGWAINKIKIPRPSSLDEIKKDKRSHITERYEMQTEGQDAHNRLGFSGKKQER